MSNKYDQYNLPPEFQANQLKFYQLGGDAQSALDDGGFSQSQNFLSSLETTRNEFVDKQVHSQGGMKLVSKVTDLHVGRDIALAELREEFRDSKEQQFRFVREARITAMLGHPNIVPIYDIGLNDQGCPFFTMKFMKDETLAKILHELLKANPVYVSKYDLNILLEIYLKVCEAVAYAHSQGIVHLDIKPENVMIGDFGEVYICDWGLAKLIGVEDESDAGTGLPHDPILNDITLSGVVKGTPGFMAPEQVDESFGDKTEKTDIYSLGALLYSILTFKTPFSGLNAKQKLRATTLGRITRPSRKAVGKVPEGLESTCLKAMRLKPQDRYDSVDEIVADIRAYQHGFVTSAENISSFSKTLKFAKRNQIKVAAVFIIVLVLALSVSFIISRLEQARSESVRKLSLVKWENNRQVKKMEEQFRKRLETKDQTIGQMQSRLTDREQVLQTIFTNANSIRGRAVKIDRQPGFVKCPDIEFRSGSVAFWFKADKIAYKNSPCFFQLGGGKWHVSLLSTDPGSIVSSGGSTRISSALLGGPLWDKWHHFVIVVKENVDMVFYVDGVKFDVASDHSGSRGLALGSWLDSNFGNSLVGSFDELSIWEDALDYGQVKQIMYQELSGEESGLRAYYKFDGNASDLLGKEPDFELSEAVIYKP